MPAKSGKLHQTRTLKIFRNIASVFVILILFPGCLLISLSPLADSVETEVENALNHGFDAIIVYVDQSYETASYAAGLKSREAEIPVEPDTLFKIASISKLYVAAAASKLVSAHVLSLDDTLAELLPELTGHIQYAETITLRMMLQHRSGIPNFVDRPGFRWVDPPKNNADALDLVLDVSADFKPDSRYKYSNTNYLLIGDILDRTLGYSHHQYIKDEILTPLGLNNTYSLMSEVNADDIMSGYDVGSEDFDWKVIDYVYPSGSMVATAEDVGIFLRALIDGSLFNDDEQAVYSSVYRYEHTGLLPGYGSIAKYNPDIDAVVVQFVNISGGDRWSRSEAIYRRIVKILSR